MFYKFPSDLTLDEVTSVVAEHNANLGVDAFLLCDKGDYIVFNYFISFAETFPAFSPDDDVATARKKAILRECRGLTFSKATGRVLARKYHKFFCVGQRPETKPHEINWSQSHLILEKLDGSMLVSFRPDGSEKIRWGTKMGLTDVAKPVEEFVTRHPQYDKMALHAEELGCSLIFEWCSRKQKIVIDYPEDRLVLTAVRDNRTGSYASYHDMLMWGQRFDVPVVGCRKGSVENIEALMAETADLIGEEGYVIRFDNGHMCKLKAAAYCLIHNTKDQLQREKDVMVAIFNDVMDDIIPFMDAGDKERVERFMFDLEQAIKVKADVIKEKVEQYKLLCEGSKKTFALSHAQNLEGFERGLCFTMWDEQADGATAIRKIIANHLGSSSRIETVRHLFGGLKWDRYRDLSVVLDD